MNPFISLTVMGKYLCDLIFSSDVCFIGYVVSALKVLDWLNQMKASTSFYPIAFTSTVVGISASLLPHFGHLPS